MQKNIILFLIYFFIVGNTVKAQQQKKIDMHTDSVYTWLTHMQQPNGLLPSSEGGKNISLYDNSLAALVFISYKDFAKAEKIFNFFNRRIRSEMLVQPGGFAQIRTIQGIPVDNQPRRWLGDNAWLLIAINNYHYQAGNNKYRKLARALSNWIISLQDVDGGLWGGYHADGTHIPKITEGNIDAFNAINGYTEFHQKLLNNLEKVRWDSKDELLIAWADNPPYKYALDLHPWSYCTFEDFPEAVLTKAGRYLNTQLSTVSKERVTGYCFDEDKDVVWLEGTGQMAVAFLKAGKELEAKNCISEMKKSIIESQLFPGCQGLPYTTNFASSYADDVLWEGVDTTPAVSSTAWYLFALGNFDPFELGYHKNIPTADKFWLKE